MADVKYKDSAPVDEPIPKGKIKAIEPGSGIKVAPEDNFSEYEKRLKDVESKREKPSKGEMLLKAAGAMMGGMGSCRPLLGPGGGSGTHGGR
jgi:ABC-type proline/glycine betaine transport system substrate-binding protein